MTLTLELYLLKRMKEIPYGIGAWNASVEIAIQKNIPYGVVAYLKHSWG